MRLPSESDEVRVLGSFHPSACQTDVIEQEFRALPFLAPCCRQERVSVRTPHDRAPEPHPDNLQWHQDGGGKDGTTHHMVVWASEQPTELKTSAGEVFETPVHAVVWYDNTRAFHRQPTGTDETRRWFVAIRCSGAVT